MSAKEPAATESEAPVVLATTNKANTTLHDTTRHNTTLHNTADAYVFLLHS